MYVFHSSSSQAQFEYALEKAGIDVKNQLIWNKPAAALGWGDYRWKHEPFFYCAVKGEEKCNFMVIVNTQPCGTSKRPKHSSLHGHRR